MNWKLQNELWLEQNALRYQDDPHFHILESGLQYRILAPGNPTDAKPSDASTVVCTYEVHLINGHRIDKGTEVSLPLSSTIVGFREGLKKIHAHGDIELFIPQELGYKEEGNGTEGSQSSAFIPPYSTLIYTIHLQAVN